MLPVSCVPFHLCDFYDSELEVSTPIYAKIFASSSSLELLLTNLIDCWYCFLDEPAIESKRSNPSLSFIVSDNDVFIHQIKSYIDQKSVHTEHKIIRSFFDCLTYKLTVRKTIVLEWEMECKLLESNTSKTLVRDHFIVPLFKCLTSLNSFITQQQVKKVPLVTHGDFTFSEAITELWRKQVSESTSEAEDVKENYSQLFSQDSNVDAYSLDSMEEVSSATLSTRPLKKKRRS
ncbi:hypothetical protein RCL1_006089 [Eukaryota sp. TZLM3-RCL]